MRGLASGSNDPYTAATALELAAAPLVPLWRDSRSVTALLDDAGSPVVPLGWPDPAELLDRVFDAVSTYGRGHPIVIDAACRLAARLGAAAPHRRDHTDRWQERLRGASST